MENLYPHAKTFDDMGQVIYQDLSQGIVIRRGNIFEAQTVKGHTNLIIAMMVKNGCMVYMHGDSAKMVGLEAFVRAVEHGDLQPRRASEIDTERLSMATIGLDAMATRRTGEEQIQYMGEMAEERFVHDARGHGDKIHIGG